jgi:putative CocE/NonD family hydrolase
LEVTGPVSVELYGESSAVDTDFTAKLIDVWPNGFAQNLTEGIIRARYRDSMATPTLMNAGQIYKLSIDLWSTSNLFRNGHSIRLEISGSNFPRFDRNLNLGDPHYGGNADRNSKESTTPATNTVYHDAKHPSVLILPIVSQADSLH